jgi:hypothetical protein
MAALTVRACSRIFQTLCMNNGNGHAQKAVLAIEMGALAEDIALSIHPHPRLSETESEVAEIFLGSATAYHRPKKPTEDLN